MDGSLDPRIDVKSPRCSHPDCNKQSIYNMPGSAGAVLCSHHKEPGMVDVVHKLCAHPDCHTQPNYNYPDKKGGVFCSQHKEPGMVDVNNKRCAHPGCNKSAWCNHVGQRGGLFCSQHKMPGMIYITNMLCGKQLTVCIWYEGMQSGLRPSMRQVLSLHTECVAYLQGSAVRSFTECIHLLSVPLQASPYF